MPHRDGHYAKLCDESPVGYSLISLITVQLYLTDAGAENGGETRFLDPSAPEGERVADVIPRRGSVLLFEHSLMHEGRVFHATALVPTKDTVRMEVVYAPDPTCADTPRISINGVLGLVDS